MIMLNNFKDLHKTAKCSVILNYVIIIEMFIAECLIWDSTLVKQQLEQEL